MAAINKQILLTRRVLTCGKSAQYPQIRRLMVFTIPIIEIKNEAVFFSTPWKEIKEKCIKNKKIIVFFLNINIC